MRIYEETSPAMTKQWGTGGNNVPFLMGGEITDALTASDNRGISDRAVRGNRVVPDLMPTLTAKQGENAASGLDKRIVVPDISGALSTKDGIRFSKDTDGKIVVAFSHVRNGRDAIEGLAPTLVARNAANSNQAGSGQVSFVEAEVAEFYLIGDLRPRKLTPKECERLQSFPADWTQYGFFENGKTKKMSDLQRYRMLGNAVTVNVAEWLGKRIMEVENGNC